MKEDDIGINPRNLLIWLSLVVFAFLYDYFTGDPLVMALLLLLLIVLLFVGLIFPKFDFLPIFSRKKR